MRSFNTIVVCLPPEGAEREKVLQAMEQLKPYQTAFSIEDEMTVLDLIENHPDFDLTIAEDARRKAKELQEAFQ